MHSNHTKAIRNFISAFNIYNVDSNYLATLYKYYKST